MIVFDGVCIERGGKRIIERADFSVPEGGRAVISGPSGSGKSTLLMALMGAVPVRAGALEVAGVRVCPENMAVLRGRVSFIGQEPELCAPTVREALELPFTFRANRHSRPGRGRFLEALADVRLKPDILEKRSSVLSGGEKQRVALARALLLGKNVFLMDEVTSALDADSRGAVMDLFFGPGAFTILSVSHDPVWIGGCDIHIECADGVARLKAA